MLQSFATPVQRGIVFEGNREPRVFVLKPQLTDGEMTEQTVSVEPGDPAAFAVQAALASGLHWLKVNERAASEGKIEGVHKHRVTTRRLRSVLDTFRSLIEPAWADHLGGELKWLGGKLGDVRDQDVLRGRLASTAEQMGTSDALAPLFADLDQRHTAASEALREALRGERYPKLTGFLSDAMAGLPFKDDAWQPCRDALPPLVGPLWKTLKRRGRALSPDDPDDDFHEVRKDAKRARYAAQAVKEALDAKPASEAARFARKAKRVQDILGLHQDAVVASQQIREAALARIDLGPFNFAAGQLLEREVREALDTRARFFEVWHTLDRQKTVRWLKA